MTSEKDAQETDEKPWRTAERDQFFSVTTSQPRPTTYHTPTFQKSWMIWARKFYLILLHSPDLSRTDNQFFKNLNNFLQGKHFHNQQEAENAFQDFTESHSMEFYVKGINKLTFCWQKCDFNGSYFNKDMLDWTYNHLKPMVWNSIILAPT